MRFCPEHGLPLVQPEGMYHGGDPTGMVVDGKYRVLSRIGEGGMGAVYRVEHQALGKLMAMKLLHRELSAHEQAVLRFEREARAASQLDHPHIILTSDFGLAPDGSLYIVMEHLVGKDLFDVLKDERFMNAERTIDVMRQVCAGLGEAHRRGVIHRDLKPENIFLANDREFPDFVKILDFGIAKVLETGPEERTLTAAGTVFGTPEYLSPEQAAGGEIDHRADLYSLGIIMYRMVTGRLPFAGGNKNSLIQRQLNEMPLTFSQRQMPQQIPEALERVIFKLLAKDPDDRYQTAEALKEALERIDSRVSGEADPALVDEAPDEPIWIEYPEDYRPEGMPPRAPTTHPPRVKKKHRVPISEASTPTITTTSGPPTWLWVVMLVGVLLAGVGIAFWMSQQQ